LRLSVYSRLFRVPHTRSLAATVWLASLPTGMYTLAVLLFIREYTGSLALAGSVAGAFGIGVALGGPPQGRLIDRFGPRSILGWEAAAHSCAFGLLLITVVSGTYSGLTCLVCALVAGGTMPRVSSVGRSIWSAVLDKDEDLLPTAYAFDAVTIESLYILGPLVATAFSALQATAELLAIATIAMPMGTALFLSLRPIREKPTRRLRHQSGIFGPLSHAGVRLLLGCTFSVGAYFGAVEVALLAFGVDHGGPSMGAILIAGLSIGSALAVVTYGAFAPRHSIQSSYVTLLTVAPFGVCVLLFGYSIPSMFVAALPAGAVLAPLFATESQIVTKISPAGSVTETFTWLGSATFAGVAVGTTLAGPMVETWGWEFAVVASAFVLAVAAVVVRCNRGLLEP
jgi:MFS family permease